MTMAAYVFIAFFLILSSPLLSTSCGIDAEQPQMINAQTLNNCSNSDNILACEIEEMKHKVARLELLLEVTDQDLHTKTLYIENCEKKIDEISRNVRQLESDLSNLKGLPDDEQITGALVEEGLPDDEQITSALEEEVRELEIDVRHNDGEIRLLKVRAKDAEKRVTLLASKVETLANIVPELWFHVQKLEQAHEVIERRTAELRKHICNHKCSFFKFINNLFSIQHQEMVSSYTSEVLNQLRWSFSALTKYHHQLQGFIKQEMGRNEFIALLADDELVFFLASAILVFPLMLALMWLSSLWRY